MGALAAGQVVQQTNRGLPPIITIIRVSPDPGEVIFVTSINSYVEVSTSFSIAIVRRSASSRS